MFLSLTFISDFFSCVTWDVLCKYLIYVPLPFTKKKVFNRALAEGLLFFSLKNGFSYKTFGRTPSKESEPDHEKALPNRS
jgi:hypothetical protein